MKKPRVATGKTASLARPAPVRVVLKQKAGSSPRACPPDGTKPEWLGRLKAALGTCSDDFVGASLVQLVKAARLPGTGTSEIAVNAALAFVEGARPRNEMEAALAIQMACLHCATMGVFWGYSAGFGGERSIAAGAGALAKLTRAFATQVEVYRRLHNGGSQLVRVEHIHINEGGQANIGQIQVAAGEPATQEIATPTIDGVVNADRD